MYFPKNHAQVGMYVQFDHNVTALNSRRLFPAPQPNQTEPTWTWISLALVVKMPKHGTASTMKI